MPEMETASNAQTRTIILFTEDTFGILNKITSVFSRRRINVDSITLSNTIEKDVIRMTIVVKLEKERVEKVVNQINKLIGVLKVFSYENEAVYCREIALYKLALANTDMLKLQKTTQPFNTKILLANQEYLILEQTDSEDHIFELFELLKEYTVLDFVKSGRVATVLQENADEHIYPYQEEQSKSVTFHHS
jgi:acetolactate synthase-1/3 small subunit